MEDGGKRKQPCSAGQPVLTPSKVMRSEMPSPQPVEGIRKSSRERRKSVRAPPDFVLPSAKKNLVPSPNAETSTKQSHGKSSPSSSKDVTPAKKSAQSKHMEDRSPKRNPCTPDKTDKKLTKNKSFQDQFQNRISSKSELETEVNGSMNSTSSADVIKSTTGRLEEGNANNCTKRSKKEELEKAKGKSPAVSPHKLNASSGNEDHKSEKELLLEESSPMTKSSQSKAANNSEAVKIKKRQSVSGLSNENSVSGMSSKNSSPQVGNAEESINTSKEASPGVKTETNSTTATSGNTLDDPEVVDDSKTFKKSNPTSKLNNLDNDTTEEIQQPTSSGALEGTPVEHTDGNQEKGTKRKKTVLIKMDPQIISALGSIPKQQPVANSKIQNELFATVSATVMSHILDALDSAGIRDKVLEMVVSQSGTRMVHVPGQTLLVGTMQQIQQARVIFNAMATHAASNYTPQQQAEPTVTETPNKNAADLPTPTDDLMAQMTGTEEISQQSEDTEKRVEENDSEPPAELQENVGNAVKVIQENERGETEVTWVVLPENLPQKEKASETQAEEETKYFPDKVVDVGYFAKKPYMPENQQMQMKPGRAYVTLNPSKANAQCKKCPFRSSVDGLRKHMRRFHARTTFLCPECHKRFALPNDLRRHWRLHGIPQNLTNAMMKERVYCEECGFQGCETDVMLHMNKEHISDIVCSRCRRICDTPEDLDVHIKKCHSTEAQEIRDIQDASRSLLSLGYVGRKGAKLARMAKIPSHQYRCIWCGSFFSHETTLRHHLKVRHIEVQSFTCQICGKMYHDERILKVHMRRLHLKEKRHFCDICNRGYFERRQMVKHRYSHMNADQNRKFMCAYCGSRFSHPSHLRAHERVHGGQRPEIGRKDDEGIVACAICGKTYRYRRSLNFHLRKLHGLDPSSDPGIPLIVPGTAGNLAMHTHGSLQDLQVVQQDQMGELRVVEDIRIEHVDGGVAAHEEVVQSREAGTAEEGERTNVQMVLDALGSGDAKFHLEEGGKEEQGDDEGNVVVYMCEVCQQLFTDMKELHSHFASSHPEMPVKLEEENSVTEDGETQDEEPTYMVLQDVQTVATEEMTEGKEEVMEYQVQLDEPAAL